MPCRLSPEFAAGLGMRVETLSASFGNTSEKGYIVFIPTHQNVFIAI
jgi:hypothetical protein